MSTSSHSLPETRTITAAEFKAKCLQLMDEVNEKHITLIVTKRGKPVMQASAPPSETKPFRSVFGRSPGGGKIPTEREWSKMKAQWAAEWENNFDRRAALLRNDKPKKRKRA